MKKIIVSVIVLLLAVFGIIVWHGATTKRDTNTVSQFIQADFIDLSKIYSISKFRSGEGHDFSGNGETCRSMKHYFTQQFDPATASIYTSIYPGHEVNFPAPDPATAVAIFSPVDGKITSVSEERTPIGMQVSIQPDSTPGVIIRLFHIYLLDGIGRGTKVKAGQQIGRIGKGQGTDIAIQVGEFPWQQDFVSYFSVMPNSVFAAYLARGVQSRDELIITKEYSDAHPFQCDTNEQFLHGANYDQTQDDVHLSGYVAMPQNHGNGQGRGQ